MKVVPVILCGGAGTRLWPLSRELYPKQLLSLVDERSLLQNTVLRCGARHGTEAPVLVCNEEHRFLIAEQMREIETEPLGILLEPAGRNTAPAIALAANMIVQSDDDAVMVVLPSDHVIPDTQAFLESLEPAIGFAESDKLVTFAVVPQSPETGYGYIRRGNPLEAGFVVDAFVEKPDLETAKKLLEEGGYYWNSGMFVFKASQYLQELETHRSDISSAVTAATKSLDRDNDFVRVDAQKFQDCPSESVDYAVMEKTTDAVVVPLDAEWSDVGSWDALWQVSNKDSSKNTTSGDVILSNVNNSYVRAEHRLVSVVGVDDVVVVETADAVMVASQQKAQDVKSIVNQLKDSEREERLLHRRVFRPWGHYEGVDAGPGFQVKRITVNPGASLSLQLHHQRAEHWIVVNGVATVTCGDDVYELQRNESTYIPIETKHRLQNLAEEPLEIIEVQSGDYLGEDDIVRFEDNYGR